MANALSFETRAVGCNFESHPAIKYTEREASMYAALVPLPHIARAVADNLRSLGPDFVACHIRRTDHTALGYAELVPRLPNVPARLGA